MTVSTAGITSPCLITFKMKKLFLLLPLLVCLVSSPAAAANGPSMDFNARLLLEGISYAPGADWDFQLPSKSFTPLASSTGPANSYNNFGQTLSLIIR